MITDRSNVRIGEAILKDPWERLMPKHFPAKWIRFTGNNAALPRKKLISRIWKQL